LPVLTKQTMEITTGRPKRKSFSTRNHVKQRFFFNWINIYSQSLSPSKKI